LTKGNYDLTFSTLTFQDYSKDYLEGTDKSYPLPLGSFGVNCNVFEPHLVDWDYDEASGRFCLLVQGEDGDWAVLLVDRLEAYPNSEQGVPPRLPYPFVSGVETWGMVM
jgi:hypothetical protein